MIKSTIPLSETFLSIQGEGSSVGKLSVFLRLGACNLDCGANGGKWICDTVDVWKKHKQITFKNLLKIWRSNGSLDAFNNGARLIITGGEPLLWQKEIEELDKFLIQNGWRPFIEIETNGTILPSNYLCYRVDQWNVSPKLANSGHEKNKTIKSKVLSFFANHPYSIFKFVITHKKDWKEIKNNYLNQYKIKKEKIFLMPGCQTKEEMQNVEIETVELAINENVNYSPRLHIQIWDEKTGV